MSKSKETGYFLIDDEDVSTSHTSRGLHQDELKGQHETIKTDREKFDGESDAPVEVK